MCKTTTFDRDAPLLHVQGMDVKILPRHHHPLLQQVLSVTCQKSTALSGVRWLSDWTLDHMVNTARRWSALAPKIANVLALDLPIVAKLCVGQQNVPHNKGEQPNILKNDDLASRRQHIFITIKSISVIIKIWFSQKRKLSTCPLLVIRVWIKIGSCHFYWNL